MDDVTPNAMTARAMHFGYDRGLGWHPTLRDALDGLDADAAAWRPAEGHNSVHDIVHHLVHWKRFVLADLDGERPDFAAWEADDWPRPATDAASWSADVAALEEVSRALLDRAGAADADALATPPAGRRTAPLWTMLNLATHDAYHAGQIQHLKRLRTG